MQHRNLIVVLTLPFLLLSWLAPAAAADAPSQVQVTPRVLELGTFYGGAKVHVAGIAAADSKVIIVVRGPSTAEVFNKLGRVGPIWVSTGKVTISGVPALLLIFSSAPVNACLNPAAIDHYELDPKSLKTHMQIETKAPEHNGIADDFLAFQAHQKKYRFNSVSVQMGALTERGLPYSLDFDMPKAAGPGKYQVNVLECRDGNVVNKADVDLPLVEVGFPALIARLARARASLYGIMAVIIAMAAGFGIDFLAARLFKRKVTAH